MTDLKKNNKSCIDGGKLDVITGPMYGGKTAHALAILDRYASVDEKFIIIKPMVDDRCSNNEISTHSGRKIKADIISKNLNDILNSVDDLKIIWSCYCLMIDEAQFFNGSLVKFVRMCLSLNKHIVVSGLNLNFHAVPYMNMATLCMFAQQVHKLNARCMICKKSEHGTYTYMDPKCDTGNKVQIGGKEKYKVCCNACFTKNYKEENYK